MHGDETMSRHSDIVYAASLNSALARISKTPALTAGNLTEAAEVIACEGCRALNTGRVGLWHVLRDKPALRSITSYDGAGGIYTVQEDFPLDGRQRYVELLHTERLLIIDDTANTDILPNLQETYGPDICALLDAPVRVGGKPAGVVCIEQKRTAHFPERRVWTIEEQNFASSLADFLALAMESAERRLLMRRTEELLNNLPGMVYRCLHNPPDYTFTFVSEGCYPLTGYTPEELLGNNAVKFFDMVHPEDVDSLARRNGETLALGVPLEATFRIVMKDGSVRWIWERSRVAEKNPDGTPHLLEGFYTDITKQRRLEAAELANRAKYAFLTKMSHEIRTPMNAVLGMAELAAQRCRQEEVFEYLSHIKRAGTSLLSIINDILDFSELESGAPEIVPIVYNIHSLINDVVTMFHNRIGDKPVDLIVDDDPLLPQAMLGDTARIKQIVVNLLSNAVKFTSYGCISLSIGVEKTDGARCKLLFAVGDTGIGIRKEDLPLLFDAFSQADTRKNPEIEGAGLGLAVAEKLVKIMGGEIHVESVYGKGSRFSFSIMQQIENPAPAVIVRPDDERCAGVRLANAEKARSIAEKAARLGVRCILAQNEDDLRHCTHVFFDADDYAAVCDTTGRNAVLIALAGASAGESALPPRVRIVRTPLTGLMVAQLLNTRARGKTEDAAEKRAERRRAGFIAPEADVLIVDDLPANLLVAEGLLAPYRMRVHTCASGREAVELVRSRPFDLVLMDHMMPEMDGVETTRSVRETCGERGRTLPVVALTANAVSGVRTMFLENGFNDFLPKPIETADLDAVLQRWIPAGKRLAIPDDGRQPLPSGDAQKLPDIAGVDVAAGVARIGGSPARYRHLLAVFRKDAQAACAQFAGEPDEDTARAFITQVHAMKSALANIGAAELSNAAALLEKAGRESDAAVIRERLAPFREELAALAERIGEALARTATRSEDAGTHDPAVAERLTRLHDALESGDIDAADDALARLQALPLSESLRDAVSEAADCILTAEFPKAADIVSALLKKSADTLGNR
ncbi:MAG: response regulator [Desulfovibrio sp.]|nr:response regulator [Desulfovibrio sp.]